MANDCAGYVSLTTTESFFASAFAANASVVMTLRSSPFLFILDVGDLDDVDVGTAIRNSAGVDAMLSGARCYTWMSVIVDFFLKSVIVA